MRDVLGAVLRGDPVAEPRALDAVRGKGTIMVTPCLEFRRSGAEHDVEDSSAYEGENGHESIRQEELQTGLSPSRASSTGRLECIVRSSSGRVARGSPILPLTAEQPVAGR
jgi:hypothetical protein